MSTRAQTTLAQSSQGTGEDVLRKENIGWAWWSTPIILTTGEEEIGEIFLSRQKVSET
jgi:hypothetical protein